MNNATVNQYLKNSGYDKVIMQLTNGSLHLHKVGFEYQIEYFQGGDFSHIVEGGIFNRAEALEKMLIMAERA